MAEDLERDGAWLGTTTDEAIFARAEARAEARGTKAGIGGLFDEASRVGADESGRGRPAETEYYDCLEVAPSATSGEIRRQYYVLARKCHPDKNLDDPDAKAKFQKIGEAYQILSDEKLRAQYDARGKEGMEDVPVVNPAAFFGVLFGSEQMENFIGRLKLATLAMAGADFAEEQDLLQETARRRLAIKLASMLDVYVDWQPPRGSAIGKKERANAFVEMMKPIAETLGSTAIFRHRHAEKDWLGVQARGGEISPRPARRYRYVARSRPSLDGRDDAAKIIDAEEQIRRAESGLQRRHGEVQSTYESTTSPVRRPSNTPPSSAPSNSKTFFHTSSTLSGQRAPWTSNPRLDTRVPRRSTTRRRLVRDARAPRRSTSSATPSLASRPRRTRAITATFRY